MRRREDENVVDDDEDDEEEFQVEKLRDQILSSRKSRLDLLANEFGQNWSRRRLSESFINGIRGFYSGSFIHPDNKLYHVWTQFILIWAAYSSFFTPFEFGFFRGLPKHLVFLDIAGQVAFLLDIVIQFFLAYRDSHTYLIVHKRTYIALRMRAFYTRLPPSSVPRGPPPATDSPLSGIEPSPTSYIPVTTDDDSHVFHSGDNKPIAIRKEKRYAKKFYRYSDTMVYSIVDYTSDHRLSPTYRASLSLVDIPRTITTDDDSHVSYSGDDKPIIIWKKKRYAKKRDRYSDTTASGKNEGVRYLLWIRLIRVRKVIEFFQTIEKDIRLNYLFTRIVKLIVVELYCTHTAACIFYYLATTLPESHEGYTWIGSLKLGDYSYSSFRDIDLGKRYMTSLYFAIVTMATVGYGDIHAVNIREMIFIMIYVSFDMILGAYLIGNMTALIVKGSKTERFRDKMTDVIKYMNRNKLGKDLRNQVKGHLRLQYESSYTEAAVLQDIPVSIRAKISQRLYKTHIENISLFEGCSSELINQIVIRVHEEFFLPGEVIMEQGQLVDQLYFVCHGVLDEIEVGSEEAVSSLKPNSSFGELSILHNTPQPYTVRVRELCRLLRLDKQSLISILETYFSDGQTILTNLREGKDSGRIKQLESNVALSKQEIELPLKVNSATHRGDLNQLKGLIRARADPNETDYDGRSPLHLAASKGYEDIVIFLIEQGVEVNITDNFGNSPLFEAIKNGHDRVTSLLVKNGASLNVEDPGSCLCMAISRRDSDFLRRLLSNGIDPNSKDYDHRTPLHVAAAEGLYLMAKLLIESGANVFSKDRRGNTPLDEGRICGNKSLVKLLEDAKLAQLTELDYSKEVQDKHHRRKCTVFPFHPWDTTEKRRQGIVLWIPQSVEELVKIAEEHLKYPPPQFSSCIILSEDAGQITDVEMIHDYQKLYLVGEET
ncbi:hypothetical protein GIB67_006190 [Kingdonia uniflora]|uniref:Potassium channel n=1 Tax=Kingdonia uniflora TaxID=39325 RepID=A0A7J7LQ80_9MAGN|nr:hypothetical protein GIB67_006190 [Kingdonia uniflora]